MGTIGDDPMSALARRLTLDTPRDLVLDEQDTDRSDLHLIAVVEELVREHQMMKMAVNWDVLHDMRRGWQIKWPGHAEKTTQAGRHGDAA